VVPRIEDGGEDPPETTMTDSELRVMLVEDDPTFRRGLKLLLEGSPGFSCAAETGSVEQALRVAVPHGNPDVVLLDINLPGMNGTEGVTPIRERFPDTAVLMLTAFQDEDRIFRSLCNGAGGYLLKKTPFDRLLKHIREASTGGAPMSPEIASKVVGLFRKLPPPAAAPPALTDQEIAFLELLADGHSYQSAADAMALSINTVRNHVRSIYDKLHVHSKSAAVSKALRAGLI